MKRICASILIFFFLIALTACSVPAGNSTNNPSNQNETEPSSQITGATDQKQKPMYSVSLSPVEENSTAADGTEIFCFRSQNISLILPEPEVADKIILDFLNRTDSVSKYAKDSLATAETAYKNKAETWQPHLLQLHYKLKRFDSTVFSLLGEKVSYTGAGHSATSGTSVTYDLVTGKTLTLTDILSDKVTEDTLTQLINSALEDMAEDKQLFTDYEKTVAQVFSEELKHLNNWYLSDNGLCFYFDPYEIAPFVSGTVIAEIPYEQLTGTLKDAYFPAEDMAHTSELLVIPFSDAHLSDYTQFSEFIIDESSTKFFLYTNGSVTDIRLSTADNSLTDESKQSMQAQFAAYTLTPGDAILVEVDMENTPLFLSCKTNGKQAKYTIVFNNDKISIEKA